jgi:hypothetical protein
MVTAMVTAMLPALVTAMVTGVVKAMGTAMAAAMAPFLAAHYHDEGYPGNMTSTRAFIRARLLSGLGFRAMILMFPCAVVKRIHW